MCMGPEMEKHTFSRSTIVCIPAHFIHAPWRILKVTRPFLMVEINQSTVRGEKSHKEIVSKEDLKRMIFVDAGYEDEGIKPDRWWPEAAGPQANEYETLKIISSFKIKNNQRERAGSDHRSRFFV